MSCSSHRRSFCRPARAIAPAWSGAHYVAPRTLGRRAGALRQPEAPAPSDLEIVLALSSHQLIRHCPFVRHVSPASGDRRAQAAGGGAEGRLRSLTAKTTAPARAAAPAMAIRTTAQAGKLFDLAGTGFP